MDSTGTLWTVGHSTLAWEAFVEMLHGAEIVAVADVRRFPGSRRHPQFGADAMAMALPQAGIDYLPFPDLGGRRRPRADTRNTAWRNEAFRGYADYMETREYAAARDRLAELASRRNTTVLCAEAMWWQCHRSLIADDFKARGWTVLHLMTPTRTEEHPFTKPARVVGGKLTYASPAPPQGTLPL